MHRKIKMAAAKQEINWFSSRHSLNGNRVGQFYVFAEILLIKTKPGVALHWVAVGNLEGVTSSGGLRKVSSLTSATLNSVYWAPLYTVGHNRYWASSKARDLHFEFRAISYSIGLVLLSWPLNCPRTLVFLYEKHWVHLLRGVLLRTT